MKQTTLSVYYNGHYVALFTFVHYDDWSWNRLIIEAEIVSNHMGLMNGRLDFEFNPNTQERPGWIWNT